MGEDRDVLGGGPSLLPALGWAQRGFTPPQHFVMAGEWRSLGLGQPRPSWEAGGLVVGPLVPTAWCEQGVTPGNFGDALPAISSSSSEPPVLRSPQNGQCTSQGGYIPKTTPQSEGNNYGVSKLGAVWGSEMPGSQRKASLPPGRIAAGPRGVQQPRTICYRGMAEISSPVGAAGFWGAPAGVGGTREGLAVFW